MCAPLKMQVENPPAAKLHPGFRLCGIRWPDRSPNGIAVLDAYYRDPNHSDVPVELAIVAHNDKACHENFSTQQVKRLQMLRKCLRQLNNMIDVPAQTRAAQQAACDKLK